MIELLHVLHAANRAVPNGDIALMLLAGMFVFVCVTILRHRRRTPRPAPLCQRMLDKRPGSGRAQRATGLPLVKRLPPG